MGLLATKRNAHRAVNYNLPAQLPLPDSETLAQAIARGQKILDDKIVEALIQWGIAMGGPR